MNHKNKIFMPVVFFILGGIACLLAFRINSYLIPATNMTEREGLILIAPIIEELLKAIPILFFAFVFIKSKPEKLFPLSFATGLGYAVLDNIFYVMNHGNEDMIFTFFRGVSLSTMHIICAVILGYGLISMAKEKLLILPGSLSLLCAAFALHGVYNLFVSMTNWSLWQMIGYILPVVIAALLVVFMTQRIETDSVEKT
jgi:RsiW-degrading membrane proteinase PrsW (M82 family)